MGAEPGIEHHPGRGSALAAGVASLPAWAGPAAVAGGALATCAVAALIDPYRGEGVPCPFHTLTGLWCPICGSTRALHSITHGRLAAGFARNPLLVVALPLLAWIWVVWTAQRVGGRRLWCWRWSRRTVAMVVAVVAAFWVARNLPWAPLRVLGPG